MTDEPVEPMEKSPIVPVNNRETAEPLAVKWGLEVEAVICERCDWGYLLPKNSLPQRCPHCFMVNLTPLTAAVEELPYTQPPELFIPFSISASMLSGSIQSFAQGIPFTPPDLNAQALQSRLRRVYLPMWLVDAEVQALWQSEAGFNYEVVSHQDQYRDFGGWSSQQVKEGRVRWEPRLGKMRRAYQNIAASALEEDQKIKNALGMYEMAKAQPYQAEALSGSFVRLPNRPPQDAWSDARPALQSAAAAECRQAIGADHIRNFRWQPEFLNQNWTLLLTPLYATFYQDDEGQPQPVLVNGQSGRISGARRASMKRAQRASLITLGVGILLFIISMVVLAVGLGLPPVLPVGIIGLVVSLIVGLGAIYPIATAAWFNKKQVTPGSSRE